MKELNKDLVASQFIGLKFDIVGGSYQPENNLKVYNKLSTGATLFLVRDKTNRYDNNAFAVCLNGHITSIVGFMPKTLTQKVSAKYDAVVKKAATILKNTIHSDHEVCVEVTLDKGTHGFYNTITISGVKLVKK